LLRRVRAKISSTAVAVGVAVNAVSSTAIRSERRIALIKPAVAEQDRAALAMKLMDSVLWVFKGTTQSNWTICSADAAQVIVVHQDEPAGHIARWRGEGKLIVVISTDSATSMISPYALSYPFPTVQVLRILEQLDAELDSAGPAGRARSNAPSNSDNPNNRGGGDRHGNDAWGFVDSLRTLRLVNSADTWFVGKGAGGSVVWVRGDGSRYCCDSATVRAIRTGTRNLNTLTLHKAASPPGVNPRSGSELAWFAGYYASNVLAPWLSERQTLRLIRWPDFGRVHADDPLLRAAQLRVVAAIDAAPATVVELCARIDVSPEIIVRTVNALASCELVDGALTAATSVANTKAASPALAGRLRELLRNIRKHLGLSS
jgi:hypothetical protein